VTDSLVSHHPEVGPLLSERAQRAKLVEAIVQVVAEKGYEDATVADVVRAARVSRGTFYELFESKQACFAAAFRLGTEVFEERVAAAVRGVEDWQQQLRVGVRAYLQTLDDEPRFARVYLLESHAGGAEHENAIRLFAERYGKSFARSGRPVPPPEALFVLSAGVGALARAQVRAGRKAIEIEEAAVGCALRLVTKEEPWT
jgi:AcrR family transcriptional regulator